MIIYDLFSGTGSATQAFQDAGHTVVKVELDPYFEADERDILTTRAADLVAKYGRPQFIWASPPCTTFSVMTISRYWTPDGKPKNDKSKAGIALVEHTINLIEELRPEYGYLIENPRAMLRKLPIMQELTRRTVTYCQYGDTRMKPTDLWGYVEGWVARPMCSNGAPCHEASPRGTRSGTQKLKNARERSRIPYALGEEILEALTRVERSYLD
jgi:hypothetical protein